MSEHPRKIGKVQTIDIETGEVVAEKSNAFTMLPCAPDVCQMRFHGTHERWPTWTDAMAHCADDVKAHWRAELVKMMREKGMDVPDDLMDPKPTGR